MAKLLSTKTNTLYLIDMDSDALKEVQKELSPNSSEILAIDLYSSSKRKKLALLIEKETPDLVLNCAGIGLYGHAHKHPVDKQIATVELNCNALLEITLAAAKALKSAKQKGEILNVSSVTGYFPYPSFAVYSASKTFVTNMSNALDYELKDDGIRVFAACPGTFESKFVSKAAGGKLKNVQDFKKMPLEVVASEIIKQLEKNQQTRIFNKFYKFVTTATRFLLPEKLLLKTLNRQYSHYPLKQGVIITLIYDLLG